MLVAKNGSNSPWSGIASRVEAHCRTLGASVLVTGEFGEALLAEGSLKLAKVFVDEGFYVLRGCKEPVRIFSVRRERLVNSLVCGHPADQVG